MDLNLFHLGSATSRKPPSFLQRFWRSFSSSRVLFVLPFLLPIAVDAQYSYTTNNGTVTITQYTGPGGAVSIPAIIAGLPVTTIGDFAFYYSSNLTSVTIPEGVTNIGFEAFYSCIELTGVTIPNSLIRIGDWAFQDCTNLAAITVGELNSVYSSMAGVLFDKSQTTLFAYPGGKAGDYTIPSTVTRIGVGAFGGCTSLTSVTIPDGIMNIGDSAFYSCTSLASVTIPNGATNIGNSAFYSCTSLASATVGNSVTGIGDYAFASCYHLAHFTMGTSVANIGYGAFSGSGLANLIIPNSVSRMMDAAFEYCGNLTSVTIGNGLTSVADFAFDACASLTSVTMGQGLTNIGVEAFGRCTNLISITIPKGISNIGDTAFFDCTSLAAVYFWGNAPSDNGSGFGGDSKATIYYLPQSTGWGATFDAIPTRVWNPQVQTGNANFGVRTNRFGFNITGASNLVIVVEACANLVSPIWTPLQTNVLNGGPAYFSDPQWKNYPVRFYRLRSF
jgi:hypothetical protein